MARFYDSIDRKDLKRVEELLKKGGIEYTLQMVGKKSELVKEIQVAEEDFAAAENALYGKSFLDH